MSEPQLPLGINELDPNVVVHSDDHDRVRCYVRGCRHYVLRPTRHERGELCPDHGIYCHHSRYGSTYSYADVRRNIIASPDVFVERIVGHPFKYESHRLGAENSEDSLSWNVFRSLEVSNLLHSVAAMITGERIDVRPFLFLWGICTTDDNFDPWDHLIAARQRFESNLPVERPQTEPDIALWLPGHYLILIEAKFTSANTFYRRGPRANSSSLTLDELRDIYQSRELTMLDYAKAKRAHRIHYQLWRNMIFAEWMAKLDHPNTKAYHVNLVREGYDDQSAREFEQLVRPEFRERFQRMTWEQLYGQIHRHSATSALVRYMRTKTAGLKSAFSLAGA